MIEIPTGLAARRRFFDTLATISARAAGITVLLALGLILVYLIYTCLPLMAPAGLGAVEETRVSDAGVFVVREVDASLWRIPATDLRRGEPHRFIASGSRALVASADELQVFDLVSVLAIDAERVRPDARRRVSIPESGERRALVFDSAADKALLAFFDASGTLHAIRLRFPVRGEVSVERWALPNPPLTGGEILLDAGRDELLMVFGDRFLRWQIPVPRSREAGRVLGGKLAGIGAAVDAVAWGPGRETLLVATADALLHRYDAARAGLPHLGVAHALGARLRWIASEPQRRVSALLTVDDRLMLFVPTSAKLLLDVRLEDLPREPTLQLSSDGSAVYHFDGSVLRYWPLRMGSPDTGWRSLWLPQHYSAYDEAAHAWQPDGVAIGVLPKYGLTPLVWGTFKAALYAMVLAVPLALGAAIYTGYFLPPRRRNQVKPAIEMLEAFPTVVIGFLAGLWFAPLLADHLFAVLLLLTLFVLAPLGLAALHLALQRWARVFVRRPPRIALVSLVYVAVCLLCLTQASRLEMLILDQPLRDWLWESLGLRYEQRNALLVGLAMGLAVTPVMFSIIEDAINAVPRSLSDGSLALGATRWQALAGVVLPAAAPAILSALLIGFARGLGETMIVLLATGNTPLLLGDPFSGLRSIAATIAAEMPEAGSGGVHFRLMFLGALVLFMLTFVLNTVAELFRQRLRYMYEGR
ncbi:MAG: ABC transporter permease subunit [Halieaceae bacterium]|jgi:phosphate transport system permease protein|nr:ABC transporter permease subunit [Halieaceae bacterium]